MDDKIDISVQLEKIDKMISDTDELIQEVDMVLIGLVAPIIALLIFGIIMIMFIIFT